MKKFIITALLSAAAATISPSLVAQDQGRELFYTYMGPVAGIGFNRITAKDWYSDRTGSKKITGTYYTGGAVFKVVVKNLEGDFTLQYLYNSNSDETLQHAYYSLAARYLLGLTPVISLSAGAGLYFDSPPSNRKYDGSTGFIIPVGMIYTYSFDTRLFVDLKGSYGSYGTGENSVKFSYGISMGALFKVGRL